MKKREIDNKKLKNWFESNEFRLNFLLQQADEQINKYIKETEGTFDLFSNIDFVYGTDLSQQESVNTNILWLLVMEDDDMRKLFNRVIGYQYFGWDTIKPLSDMTDLYYAIRYTHLYQEKLPGFKYLKEQSFKHLEDMFYSSFEK